MLKYCRGEPVAIQGLIQAFLAVLVGFGVITMTNEQTGLVLALVAAILTTLARHHVTPNSKIDAKVPTRK
jgi:uncharacterized membrane protein